MTIREFGKDTGATILEKGDTSNLTEEEKTKLEPCIIEKEAAAPSSSPAGQ